jgi:mannose/cellobiose epimerase-like protein (N-acyl-D-glucosamine 2-epimerase family)
MAWRQFGETGRPTAAAPRPAFLRDAHRNPATGGYAWQLDWNAGEARVTDGTNHCYGLAFVLLAYAHALMAGVDRGARLDRRNLRLDGARFWEPAARPVRRRGQRRLVHLRLPRPERQHARLRSAARRLRGDRRARAILLRAETLAHNITQRQAAWPAA